MRTDIEMRDVFISWTAKDREIKETISQFLTRNSIKCLESEENCCGDYRQWSKDAVGACSVFLLIFTKNIRKSRYVPLELEEFKKLDDWENRIIPVCFDKKLYRNDNFFDLSSSESAIFLEKDHIEEHLQEILNKTVKLLIHRQYSLYRLYSRCEYLRLPALYRLAKLPVEKYSYDALYVNRSLFQADSTGKPISACHDAKELISQDHVVFIQGAMGCGKTQYIHQIKEAAEMDTLVLSLPCSQVASASEDILTLMYREFKRICGNRVFYSENNFMRLLSVKRLVLVLDGLDEIATRAGFQMLIEKTEMFYRSNHENVTLIFTGRDWRDASMLSIGGQEPKCFILTALNDEEVVTLISNLFVSFDLRDKEADFCFRIASLDDEITHNPFMLSQLALIYRNEEDIPQTVVGIYDAMVASLLRWDDPAVCETVPKQFLHMLQFELVTILKDFSRERYLLASQGKKQKTVEIFERVLRGRYGSDSGIYAAFLTEYLNTRSILNGDQFFHKMILEYFTALSYYDRIFDINELEDIETLTELFSHYRDPYWAEVIRMFLIKSDAHMEHETVRGLFDTILSSNAVVDYTLLLDSCKEMIRCKKESQLALICDMLKKSTDGRYPPYGPLFWYVPEYDLYEIALQSLAYLRENAVALALVRDVCVIFGAAYSASELGMEHNEAIGLYRAASSDLHGVRKALCELFYTGETDDDGDIDIYPRCFHVGESRSLLKNRVGTIGRYLVPFEDELGLYSHRMQNRLGGELCGLLAWPYSSHQLHAMLSQESVAKVSAILLSPGECSEMKYIHFDRSHLRKMYIPEDAYIDIVYDNRWDDYLSLSDRVYCPPRANFWETDDGICYIPLSARACLPTGGNRIPNAFFKKRIDLVTFTVPEGIVDIGEYAFFACESLEEVRLSSTVKHICRAAFAHCSSLKRVIFAKDSSLEWIGEKSFAKCHSIETLSLPDSVKRIDENAFYRCDRLRELRLPQSDEKVYREVLTSDGLGSNVRFERYAFADCLSLSEVRLPIGIKILDSRVFEGCTCLRKLYLPPFCELRIHSRIYDFVLPDLYYPNGIENEEIMFGRDQSYDIWYTDIYRDSASALVIYRLDQSVRKILTESVASQSEWSDSSSVGSEKIRYRNSSSESVIVSGAQRFSNLRKLITAQIGDDVCDLAKDVFMNCVDLRRVYFSENLVGIASGAFQNCRSLCEFALGNRVFTDGNMRLPSVYHIDANAFEGCVSIKRVCFTEPLYKIGPCAFRHCTGLLELSIPLTVQYIGDEAFGGCTGLKRVVISRNFQHDVKRIFGSIDENVIRFI